MVQLVNNSFYSLELSPTQIFWRILNAKNRYCHKNVRTLHLNERTVMFQKISHRVQLISSDGNNFA